MADPLDPQENPRRWAPAISWPPRKWLVEQRLHFILDFGFAALLLMLIATCLGGILVWAGLLFQAIQLSFKSGAHEALRNALLGLAALLGAPFVVWRTIIAAQQTAINREAHYTGLFTKAAELISADKVRKDREFKPRFRVDESGGFLRGPKGEPVPAERPDGTPIGEWTTVEETVPNIEARMGAIYALERIAQDSERDHWSIMETLTAYVRNNVGRPLAEEEVKATGAKLGPRERWTSKLPPPRPDIQAAITVVSRRPVERIIHEQSKANKLQLDLRAVNLQRAEVRNGDLSNAQLRGAWLSGTLLHGSNLSHVDFMEANLDEAELTSCVLSNAMLMGASLLQADLFEAKCSVTNFDYSDMRDTNFELAEIRVSSFHKTKLDGAQFIATSAHECDFSQASLVSADFHGAELTGSTFAGANLMWAKLVDVDWDGVELVGANLAGAEINRAKNLTDQQVSAAFLGTDVKLSQNATEWGISGEFRD